MPKDASWSVLTQYFQWHPMYTAINNPTKYNSTWHQYACHSDYRAVVDFVKERKWNLEPAKPDKGYWGFVATTCN